jgi:hypothetical protein
MKRGSEIITPTLFGLASVRKSLLLSASSLVEALVARRRDRGSYADRAAGEVYVASIGIVLGNTLLVGDVAGIGHLLSGRAGIDVITTVAKAR